MCTVEVTALQAPLGADVATSVREKKPKQVNETVCSSSLFSRSGIFPQINFKHISLQ